MIAGLVGLAFLTGFFGGWAIAVACAAGAILFALASGKHWVFVPVVTVALMAGSLRNPESDLPLTAPVISADVPVTGTVASDVVDDGQVQRFTFRSDDWSICARTFARGDIGRGDRLTAEIEVTDPSTLSAGYRQYLRSRGCAAAGTLGQVSLVGRGDGVRRTLDDVRQSVTRQVVSWVPGDRGALLAGLVIGDDSLMSDEATDAFARTGTIHVVAVSGSNLALLASMLVIANVLFLRRIVSEVIGIGVIWGYVLLGGAVPPTLRAGMLATVAAGSRLVGRPTDVLTLSVQVAAVQAAIWPSSTLGLSYRLSTVAIFAVVIATAGRSFDGWFAGLRLVAMTTIVVNVAMMPILPEESRPILLVSLLTNIAIAPLIAVSFTLGVIAIAVGLVVEPLGRSIAIAAGELNGITLAIVNWMAGIKRMPGPLESSGSSAPRWLLVLFAAAFLASASTEFRRWLRDIGRSGAVITDRSADVAIGAAAGAVCATLAIALMR